MTKQEFDELKGKMQRGDFLAVHVIDDTFNLGEMASMLTQFGTGECCHIQLIVEPLTGACISADGKSVAIHNIDEYEKILPAVTLYLMRLPDVTSVMIDDMVKYAESRIGVKYNWNIIRRIGMKSATYQIPLVGLWLKSWLPDVGRNNPKCPTGVDGTICSKEATLYIRQIYPDYLSRYNIDDITPTMVWREPPLEIVDRG